LVHTEAGSNETINASFDRLNTKIDSCLRVLAELTFWMQMIAVGEVLTIVAGALHWF
jgi:hypothetical protein